LYVAVRLCMSVCVCVSLFMCVSVCPVVRLLLRQRVFQGPQISQDLQQLRWRIVADRRRHVFTSSKTSLHRQVTTVVIADQVQSAAETSPCLDRLLEAKLRDLELVFQPASGWIHLIASVATTHRQLPSPISFPDPHVMILPATASDAPNTCHKMLPVPLQMIPTNL